MTQNELKKMMLESGMFRFNGENAWRGGIQDFENLARLVSAHAITSMQTEQEKKIKDLEALLNKAQTATCIASDYCYDKDDKDGADLWNQLNVEISNALRNQLTTHDIVKGVSDSTAEAIYEKTKITMGFTNAPPFNELAEETKQIYRDKVSTNTDGWVSVPIEPTDEMIFQARFQLSFYLLQMSDELRTKMIKEVYKAMIAISQDKGE